VRATSPPSRRVGQLADAASELKRAWDARDLAALVHILDPHVEAITDGGGHVTAAAAPINGSAAVARLLLDATERQRDLVVHQAQVSAEPGLVTRDAGGRVLAVMSMSLSPRGIDHIWVVRNPKKLRRWRSSTAT
jgi:RNA polymerase sigma-70 factor (ECF subfamily)